MALKDKLAKFLFGKETWNEAWGAMEPGEKFILYITLLLSPFTVIAILELLFG